MSMCGIVNTDHCPFCLRRNYTCKPDCPAEKAREADRQWVLSMLAAAAADRVEGGADDPE